MATTHNKTKAFILLTLTVSLPSVIIIYSMSKSNPTANFRRINPRDSISIAATTDSTNNGPPFIANIRPFPPNKRSQVVPTIANRTIKHSTNCGSSVRVVFLPGNWIDATDSGYQAQNCDVPCMYTKDTSSSAVKSADAVVVYLPSHSKHPDNLLKKYRIDSNKVLKVGMSMESIRSHPHQFDYLSEYDIEMSYRMSSHVPDPYFTFARGKQNLLEETNSTWKSREKAVLFVARNCKSNSQREQLVKMLQKFVRVDSVSSCLNNKHWPSDIPRIDKRALLRRYMAILAAENSIEDDYVTEKVYAGLITGAVPIYYGAPNIDEFVPSDSIIKVPHPLTKSGVKEVAERIERVFNSEEEYNRLTHFKRLGSYEDRFLEMFNFTRIDVKCRLCQKIMSLKCK
ncbi:uncharacterized protein LOC135343235 [Halichondria panicea]|uniref:uncharacterized protein LOC135343235 n=1 Tax=Halichondria panicea TaxID=6063 RepID=UPI00312B5816